MLNTPKFMTIAMLTILIWTVSTVTAVQASGKVFMWKVRAAASGRSNTVWLLGSVHVADSGVYPLDKRITSAFSTCQTLAVEADITSPGALFKLGGFMQSGLYPEGDTLERHISAATRSKMADAGVDIRDYDRMRPWLAVMTMTTRRMQALGYDAAFGLDRHFLGEATARGMKIVELEGVERQIKVLTDLGKLNEDVFLNYSLDEYSRMERVVHDLFSAWKRGDAEAMNTLVSRDMDRDPRYRPLYDTLFTGRNAEMATKVAGFVGRMEDIFVVVGAGHLVGESGLVRRLQALGYVVEQQ